MKNTMELEFVNKSSVKRLEAMVDFVGIMLHRCYATFCIAEIEL